MKLIITFSTVELARTKYCIDMLYIKHEPTTLCCTENKLTNPGIG